MPESESILLDVYKTSEMNVSDTELSKKSKIIEIGSAEKKLWLLKVGWISKKSQNPKIFVRDFRIFLHKLSQILKIRKIRKKFFDFPSFSFYSFNISFGMLLVNKISNGQNFLDFRFFDFFDDFGLLLLGD